MGSAYSVPRPAAAYSDHDSDSDVEVQPMGYIFPDGFVQGQLGFLVNGRSRFNLTPASSESEDSEDEYYQIPVHSDTESDSESEPEDWESDVGTFVFRLYPHPSALDSDYESDGELWALEV